MPTNGMTIDSLNTVSSLTAQDEVPVWDKEASGEPTRKITAQNMTNSVKTLGSLVNTTEMNNAIAQSTADVIRTGDVVNSLTSTATDKPLSSNMGNKLAKQAIAGEVATDIPSNSNLNSYITPGIYSIDTDEIAGTISNVPYAASGKLIVVRRKQNYVTQFYLPTSTDLYIYARNYDNSTWSDWNDLNYNNKMIVHTGTVTTSSSGTASFTTTYNTNEYMCLSVVTPEAVSGRMLIPYKYGDAENGRWGLQAISSGSLAIQANTSISYIAVMYKYA